MVDKSYYIRRVYDMSQDEFKKYYEHNTDKFIEDYFGIRLPLYQRIFIKLIKQISKKIKIKFYI